MSEREEFKRAEWEKLLADVKSGPLLEITRTAMKRSMKLEGKFPREIIHTEGKAADEVYKRFLKSHD